MKRYAELIGNYKSQRIKSLWDNKLVIDSDYRGSIIVALYNDSDTIQTVNPGDRIAQLVLLKYYDINLEEVNELDSTERGSNGLGSTGR